MCYLLCMHQLYCVTSSLIPYAEQILPVLSVLLFPCGAFPPSFLEGKLDFAARGSPGYQPRMRPLLLECRST